MDHREKQVYQTVHVDEDGTVTYLEKPTLRPAHMPRRQVAASKRKARR
jgi:hypothetical protein